ncbi:hypothetical protein ACJMK2_008617 [Sinanodonta woodiana]|uniref:Uncharacterized protein n=1 Tax=Sinanodonta woodiana TaxID=1069815 RepID=A0ABD3VQ56_SINWO
MDYTIHIIGMMLLLFCTGIYTEKPFRDLYTVGNTKCKAGTDCESKGKGYRWCYVDDIGNWDYCCSDACAMRADYTHTYCYTGRKWAFCTEPSHTAEHGQSCITEFPCGIHADAESVHRYWCHTDESRQTQVPCCPPYTPHVAEGCNM